MGQGTTFYKGMVLLETNCWRLMYVPSRMNRIKEGMLRNAPTNNAKEAGLTRHVIVCLSSHSYEHQCSNRYHVNKLDESFTSFLVMAGIKWHSFRHLESHKVHHHYIDAWFIGTMLLAVDWNTDSITILVTKGLDSHWDFRVWKKSRLITRFTRVIKSQILLCCIVKILCILVERISWYPISSRRDIKRHFHLRSWMCFIFRREMRC